MKKIKWQVVSATAFAVFYHFVALLGVPDAWIFMMFVISPFVMIWLVYQVLTRGEASAKTFDEYFYEDHPYRRNLPAAAPEEGDLL